MPDPLVRDLDPQILDHLNRRAAGNRSSQAEVERVLIQAALASGPAQALELARRIRAELGGRVLPDSAPGPRGAGSVSAGGPPRS